MVTTKPSVKTTPAARDDLQPYYHHRTSSSRAQQRTRVRQSYRSADATSPMLGRGRDPRHCPSAPQVQVLTFSEVFGEPDRCAPPPAYGGAYRCTDRQFSQDVTPQSRRDEIRSYLPLVSSWIMVMGAGLFYSGVTPVS